jgi:hypothetical protein
VALALALLGALPIGVALLDHRVRDHLRLAWVGRELHSTDARVRHATRLRVLEVGRPAIDGIYAELVASEIADELTGTTQETVLVVGHRWKERAQNDGFQWSFFDIDDLVAASSPRLDQLYRNAVRLAVDDEIGCPTAQRLVKTGAKRELVLAGRPVDSDRTFVLRVAVPLDDDLAPQVLEAVRERVKR